MLRNWWALTDGDAVEVVFGTDRDAAARSRVLSRSAGRPYRWRAATQFESWNVSLGARHRLDARECAALAADPAAPPLTERAQFWFLVCADGARVPYFGTAEEALTCVLQYAEARRYASVEPATVAEARAVQAMLRAAAGDARVRVLSVAASSLVVPGYELLRAH